MLLAGIRLSDCGRIRKDGDTLHLTDSDKVALLAFTFMRQTRQTNLQIKLTGFLSFEEISALLSADCFVVESTAGKAILALSIRSSVSPFAKSRSFRNHCGDYVILALLCNKVDWQRFLGSEQHSSHTGILNFAVGP